MVPFKSTSAYKFTYIVRESHVWNLGVSMSEYTNKGYETLLTAAADYNDHEASHGKTHIENFFVGIHGLACLNHR